MAIDCVIFLQVFSIIVFSCIAADAYSSVHCAYGAKSNCGYGTAVGVLAFLGLLVFLVLDALFDNLSNVEHRKYIVIGDIAFSGSIFSFSFHVSHQDLEVACIYFMENYF